MANTPLRGRYLVRNPLWNGWLWVSDWALGFRLTAQGLRLTAYGSRLSAHGPRPTAHGSRLSASRVLVALSGHIGDAVIATSVLGELARRLPGVELGVLCSSWNRAVFDGHPLVRRVHVVDHWKLNRGAGALARKLGVARRTRTQAIAEIQAAGYDAAMDLASYYPNSSRVLYAAGVPVRIGYESGGGGPLYTTAHAWRPVGHVTGEHFRLLDTLAPAVAGPPTYDLGAIPREAATRVAQRFGDRVGGPYVVVHPGAGKALKEWPRDNWSSLVRELARRGLGVLITGTGPEQARTAAGLCEGVDGVTSLVDRLDWMEFRAIIAGARLVISVDTVAMHLAAAAGTPCVALLTGMDRPDRWRPLGSTTTVLSQPVACAPCYRSRGCAAMSCIREVGVQTVLGAAEGS